MSDKLLFLFRDWILVEAEGTTAILVAGLITACFGLLSVIAFNRPPSLTKHNSNAAAGHSNNVRDQDR